MTYNMVNYIYIFVLNILKVNTYCLLAVKELTHPIKPLKKKLH